MISHLRYILPAAALVALAISAAPRPAMAAGGAYCISLATANGEAGYVSNCIYANYQDCLTAIAGRRGNCVANVEYRAESDTTSSTPRRR